MAKFREESNEEGSSEENSSDEEVSAKTLREFRKIVIDVLVL